MFNRLMGAFLIAVMLIHARKGRDLRGGSASTNNGAVAVEDLCDFLQRETFGLDVVPEDDGDFKRQPAAVDNVILPANSIEGNGVSIGVEEKSQVDEEEHGREALGTEAVRKNLARVRDKHSAEREIVADVVEEHAHDKGVRGLMVLGAVVGIVLVSSRRDRHTSVPREH